MNIGEHTAHAHRRLEAAMRREPPGTLGLLGDLGIPSTEENVEAIEELVGIGERTTDHSPRKKGATMLSGITVGTGPLTTNDLSNSGRTTVAREIVATVNSSEHGWVKVGFEHVAAYKNTSSLRGAISVAAREIGIEVTVRKRGDGWLIADRNRIAK